MTRLVQGDLFIADVRLRPSRSLAASPLTTYASSAAALHSSPHPRLPPFSSQHCSQRSWATTDEDAPPPMEMAYGKESGEDTPVRADFKRVKMQETVSDVQGMVDGRRNSRR